MATSGRSGKVFMQTGKRNLITDVAGVRVGNEHNTDLRSGVSVLLGDAPMVAAVDVRGGGPGTRETDALGAAGAVEHAHAVVLSGGSAFGLGAATGVQCHLAEHGIGFEVAGARVPIVPQAILFDLANGGDKRWDKSPPYERMARAACEKAGLAFALGSVGAGYGATTAVYRGGLGSASASLESGITVGAMVAVNPAGCVTVPGTPHFWAAPLERDAEFGGHGLPARFEASHAAPVLKTGPHQNTTLGIVATDAVLTRTQAQRVAIMAQTGLARAVVPAHTPLDGDVVFALATLQRTISDPLQDVTAIGITAASTLARAIARAVYEAGGVGDGWTDPPAYHDRFSRPGT